MVGWIDRLEEQVQRREAQRIASHSEIKDAYKKTDIEQTGLQN